MNLKCPLCHNQSFAEKMNQVQHLARKAVRFHQCAECKLIFLEPGFYLSAGAEQARYQTHQNTRDNQGYVAQFDFIRSWMTENLKSGSRVLEYGCGPGPVLAELLKEDGFEIDIYDPFFFKNDEVFARKYDAITSTEAVEHFYHPKEELEKLRNLLSENGVLIMQTQFYTNIKHFENWHYGKDPTHVCFFHEETWNKYAENSAREKNHVRIEYNLSPHVIMRKLN
jgi:hypothetical protein